MYRCAGAVQTLRPGKYPRNRELGWQLVGALVKQTTVERPFNDRCQTVQRPPCRSGTSGQHRHSRMDASLRAHGVVVTRPRVRVAIDFDFRHWWE